MSSMISYSLAGEWQFRQAGGAEWLPANVPGGVHTDLLAAGRLPDPFVGDQERRVQWVAEQDWEYRRVFSPDADMFGQDAIFLVCDGLDTLADVSLNGQPVGDAANMFRQYRWDVRDLLRRGDNELLILFRSAVAYAAARDHERHLPDVNNPIPGAPYVRKAPSHFGWDWGPHLPPTGIWRDIRLEGYCTARLADVHLRQQHEGGQVMVAAQATTESYRETPLRLMLRLTAPAGHVQSAAATIEVGQATAALLVDDPQLWWPNDLGAQPLYTVAVELTSGDTLLDSRSYQIGLRTLELRQQPDEWGKSFTFVVNGVPIFAKGANWIPGDSFPTRITPAQLDHLVGSAAATHKNMLRLWGGGYYEDEYFYDLCDRHGILVWQDFQFACSGYPLADEGFLENVRGEVVDNVRRLRHRACLALWCGNNEIESAWAEWGWGKNPAWADLIAADERFFYHILPAWVVAEDPDHSYWPSSPSSNVPFQNPSGGASGDIHQWAVWHANKPFTNYRETPARFVSEFGFQSIPDLATVASFAAPPDWNITSYIMEQHQRSPVGNEKIVIYLLDNFRLPKDFAALVYLSQVLQAEAMRYGVEGWRRDPACSGALYWQLNDCWPVISWASIDYYGRWKAIQYAAHRFFAPLHLSVEDDGDRMSIAVSNDQREPWAGSVRWSLETLTGARLDGAEIAITAAPLATLQAASIDFAAHLDEDKRRDSIMVCELWQDDGCRERTIATFAPTKHLLLVDPQISTTVSSAGGAADRLVIQLQAQSLARFVALALEGADVIFSDNYFDLPAGRDVSVTCLIPAGWSLQQARAALKIRSVFDSF